MRTYRVFYEPCEPWQDAWKLDIERIVFVGANGAEVRRSSVICSGSCDQTGYAAENAFEENAMVWGGRGHPTSHRIWLGITTDDIVVDCRIIADAVGAHLTLQERVADHTWRSLRRWRIDDSVGGLTETPTWVSEWQLFGLTAEPSDDRPLETVGDLHDVCYRRVGHLQAAIPSRPILTLSAGAF
ncbi:Uncharacterized protein PBTT_00434 [Plasmodiophora brassicae]